MAVIIDIYDSKKVIEGSRPSNPSYVQGEIPPVLNNPDDRLPPVDNSYASQAAMIADQGNQTAQYIYFDSVQYWEYLGTTTPSIADYRAISAYVSSGETPINQIFTYTSSNVFSLSDPDPTIIYVALNGQVLTEGSIYDYTVVGTQLTVTTPINVGGEITVLYYSEVPKISLYGRNIDGGAPDSVYLPIQNVEGGTP